MSNEKVRLRRLVVENYRGVEHMELNLSADPNDGAGTTVLGGANGAGKTSILEAALLGLNADKLLLRPNSIGERAVRQGAADYRIVAEFDVDGRNFKVERNASQLGVKLPHPRAAYFSSWRGQKYVGGVAVTAGKKGKRPDSRNEENRLWILKQFLVNARAHDLFREQKGSAPGVNGNVRFDEVIERLNRVWKGFYPRSEPSISVDEVSDDPDAGFDVYVRLANQAKIPLDELSSGQQELATIFGWFISQRLDGALIVIDEPELHLDHSWHRTMMRAMRDVLPNSQFLVATHSPEVFESVYSYERFFLEPGKPQPVEYSENRRIGQ